MNDRHKNKGGPPGSPLALTDLQAALRVAEKHNLKREANRLRREIEAITNPNSPAAQKRVKRGKDFGKFNSATRPDPVYVEDAQDMIDFVDAQREYRAHHAVCRYRPGTLSWAREILTCPNTYRHLPSEKQAELVGLALNITGCNRRVELGVSAKYPICELIRVKCGSGTGINSPTWVRLVDYILTDGGGDIRVILQEARSHLEITGSERIFRFDQVQEIDDE